MEATVLSVGKSVLNGALGYAQSALAEEVALQLGVRRDQLFITNELEMMQAFLMAAHDERDDNHVVKVWVKQVRDVAYDVEDSLQEFAVRLGRQSWWRMRRTLQDRRLVAKQMKELRANVEDVSQRNMRYNLISKGSGSKPVTAAEQSSITSAELFGIEAARRTTEMEKSKVDLVQLINKKEDDLMVIAVWGTSADLGQTSIIRTVYDNPDIKSQFPCRAWVRLTHPFNPNDFIQSSVKQFDRAVGANSLLGTEKASQELADEFNGYVNKKKYLIVLNNLSTIEEWDQVENCFPNNKMGSRIIVSTSQVEVASLCAGQECIVSELKQLSADQYIYAFYDKGSHDGTDLTKTQSSSNIATTISTDNKSTTPTNEISENQAKGADENKVLFGREVDLTKTGSSSNIGATTTRTDNKSTAPTDEISEDQAKGADENKVLVGSEADLTKIMSSSNIGGTTTSTNNNSIVPTSEILADQAKGAGENKIVGKSFSRIRTMAAALEESHVVGRVKEKENITKLITSQATQQFQVISVWGMGGIGKTTLIRDMYQSQELSGTFEKRACVTIMRPFNLAVLLRSLVIQLHRESSEKKEVGRLTASTKKTSPQKTSPPVSPEDLIEDLARVIENKSCLIVLDDVSSTAEWSMIIRVFDKMKNKILIIVTTREENIAKHCSEKQENIYMLKVLEDKDAHDLFTKKVFGKNTCLDEQYPELVEQANQILKKCNGLPLAIVTIGGFLANQPKTYLEWRKLNGHISAELEMNPELGSIRTVLTKSYDGLPYHLKSCFLYMPIFPEDIKIRRRRLVRRWTAEGYPRGVRGKSVEEISDCYFMELISRSMILPSQLSFYSIKGIDSCQVHDLMREIGISKSLEENLVFTLEEGYNLNNQATPRHITINSNWKGDQAEFESIVDMSRVRSLTVFGKWKSFFISDKMSMLRVLDLENTTGLRDHDVKHIGKLLHLRYLSLRGCNGIFHLPNSLGNLRQLETLDVRGTPVVKLPKSIIKLERLSYLCAGRKSDFEGAYFEEDDDLPRIMRNRLCTVCLGLMLCCCNLYDNEDMNRCYTCRDYCFSQLPFWVMHLDLYGVAVPRGMRKLKALCALGIVNIARGKDVVKDIKRLTQLRKLGVTGINKKNGQEFCSEISALSRLESLSMRSDGKQGLCGCLDGMSSPPENLQSLKLYGNLVKLPAWIKALKNLVKLKLRSTKLSDARTTIEVLGNLPNLASLHLLWRSFQQDEEGFCLNFQKDAFPSLLVLEIYSINPIKFEEAAAPKLELLKFEHQIIISDTISGLPSLWGLKEVWLEGEYNHEELEWLRAELAKNLNKPVYKIV